MCHRRWSKELKICKHFNLRRNNEIIKFSATFLSIFCVKNFSKEFCMPQFAFFLSLQKSFLFCQKVNNSPNCRSNYTWHSPAVVEPKILRHFSWKHFANGQLGQWQSQLNFEQAFTLTVLSRLVNLILLNYRPILNAP